MKNNDQTTIDKRITVSILGASGYGGGELLRLLLGHPNVEIKQVTSRQYSKFPVTIAHPNLRDITDLKFSKPEDLEECDLLFLSMPNGKSQEKIDDYMKLAPKIIDLGADFRLNNLEDYNNWYGEHQRPELLEKFVYGIAELHRDEIANSNYVACGGCEATCSILTLYPLYKNNLVELDRTVIDAKLGSSAAGSKASSSSHHPERSGAVRSYQPTMHRHTAEIEQEMNLALSSSGPVPFYGMTRGSTPQSEQSADLFADDIDSPITRLPARQESGNDIVTREAEGVTVHVSATAIEMVRGILVTAHAFLKEDLSKSDIWKVYRETYKDEPFIRLINDKMGNYRMPEPKLLEGTNFCDIGLKKDKRSNRVVVVGAIDNLGKGTAGQAVQAMNIMHGWGERMGLEFTGLHPI